MSMKRGSETIHVRRVAAVALFLAALLCMPGQVLAQGGKAGAFTRLGFGARGMGMGNAMSAITSGAISSTYNPALTPFQSDRVVYGNYSVLALDRALNQISYTQRVTIRKNGANKFPDDPDALSIAGVSAGWTNAGDADVMGYDSDGFQTEKMSVFENQFFLNFGNRFTPRMAGGFNVKFYYAGLYKDVTSSGFGVDIGILYSLSERLSIAMVAQELLTKYKWDTGALYGPENGKSTEDPFIRIYRLAAASTVDVMHGGVVAVEAELYGSDAVLLRAGAEVALVEQLTVRAGLDRMALKGDGIDPRPSFGVSFTQPVSVFHPTISYAFILEPVAPAPTHVLSFALTF
ncbi:MAG: hypothetical protein HY962_01385 [Ignavibacteriae bacterium]|nr:hypothetical protein [Ignavibacteriota bacterium]